MLDQGEQDDKIIGVHADDPGRFHQIVFAKEAVIYEFSSLTKSFPLYVTEYRDYTDISQLPPHRLLEIKRYKKLLVRLRACSARTTTLISVGFSKITKRMRTKKSRLMTS